MAVPEMINNTPSAGHISWALFHIQYEGVGYEVAAGSTSNRWVWWRYNGGAPAIETGAIIPEDLTDDDLLLFGNKDGIAIRMQSANLIDGELIVDGSILADAIAANQIQSAHIVTTGLDAGVIKFGEMDGDRIEVNTLAGDRIFSHSVTAEQIKADTITANEIAGDTITANEIATGAITAAEIAGRTITALEIKSGTITANEIKADTITANEIATDTITANEIASGAITATELAAEAVTASKIAAGAIDADKITANTITQRLLTTRPGGGAVTNLVPDYRFRDSYVVAKRLADVAGSATAGGTTGWSYRTIPNLLPTPVSSWTKGPKVASIDSIFNDSQVPTSINIGYKLNANLVAGDLILQTTVPIVDSATELALSSRFLDWRMEYLDASGTVLRTFNGPAASSIVVGTFGWGNNAFYTPDPGQWTPAPGSTQVRISLFAPAALTYAAATTYFAGSLVMWTSLMAKVEPGQGVFYWSPLNPATAPTKFVRIISGIPAPEGREVEVTVGLRAVNGTDWKAHQVSLTYHDAAGNVVTTHSVTGSGPQLANMRYPPPPPGATQLSVSAGGIESPADRVEIFSVEVSYVVSIFELDNFQSTKPFDTSVLRWSLAEDQWKAEIDAGTQWASAATTGPITLSGYQTIDGYTFTRDDDVCLVKNQAAPGANGLYLVRSGAWVRAKTASLDFQLGGMPVRVMQGTVNGGGLFVSTGSKYGTPVGSVAIKWYRIDNLDADARLVSADARLDALETAVPSYGILRGPATDQLCANGWTIITMASLEVGNIARGGGNTAIVPSTGLYTCTGWFIWDNIAGTSLRRIGQIESYAPAPAAVPAAGSGATIARQEFGMVAGVFPTFSLVSDVWLTAGTLVRMSGYQNSGANLNVKHSIEQAKLTLRKVS